MTADPLGIAVVGAGVMGRDHVRYVCEDPATRLVAISDPAPSAAGLAAATHVPWYPDHQTMLDEQELDGVIIATPNRLHLSAARETIGRGIPTLIEKPISDDLNDATRFAVEARRAGVPVLVGQYRRHNVRVQAAKRAIDSGRLGTIVTVSVHETVHKPDAYFEAPWRREPGAGPILINLAHDVDLLRYLLGEPVEVQAMAANRARGFDVEDSAVVNVRFASGALASCTLSDAAASPWNWEATSRENPFFAPFGTDSWLIMGTRGSLSLPTLKLFTYRDGAPDWSEPLTCEIEGVRDRQPHRVQLQHFARVILGEEAPVVPPEDAIRSLVVLDAITRATRDGGSVVLDPGGDPSRPSPLERQRHHDSRSRDKNLRTTKAEVC